MKNKNLEIPLYQSKVIAGFPSPADDFIEKNLDLNEYLIKHPAATFFVRVEGNSMINAGIHHGDLLIVDRSLEPRDGKIVIAAVDGELTLKQIQKTGKKLFLLAQNPDFPRIEVLPDQEFLIWGVVIHVIHSF